MNTPALDAAAVARIIASMARSHARQAFFSDEPVPLAQLPEGVKNSLTGDVLRFFGLEPGDVRAADTGDTDDYAHWAARVHEAMTVRAARELCRVTFVTSGSTGRPCPHSFSLEELAEEADALAPFFADRRRVVSVMPVHHVYGFAFAMMLPRVLGGTGGIPVLEVPPLPSADFFRSLREGDMVLAFPIFWKAFLDICSGPAGLACPPDIHGVTSGAPCPPETIESLLASSPTRGPVLGGMTEIYGATEFGAVGMRRDCRAPYTLLPHWQRVALMSGQGPDAEPGADGLQWGIARSRGPLLSLPDAILWHSERAFIPKGRKDRAVQVGGVNVFPPRIADILRSHPQVRDCAVRLMRPEEGERLKAFIVPQDTDASPRILTHELRHWLAARLDSASMPKSFSFGVGLPRTASGKLADWNI